MTGVPEAASVISTHKTNRMAVLHHLSCLSLLYVLTQALRQPVGAYCAENQLLDYSVLAKLASAELGAGAQSCATDDYTDGAACAEACRLNFFGRHFLQQVLLGGFE
jgi:hypothetical protein